MKLETREFLRAVRGKRSQVAFSKRLQYRGNPVADWEAGRRCPTAAEALRACTVVGIDVSAAFDRFQKLPLEQTNTGFDIAGWLDRLRGSVRAGEIARRCERNRYQIGRWLKGDTQPRLTDLFAMVQAITGRLCDLVAELVPIEQVSSLHGAYLQRLAARRLAHEEPWTEAIIRVIETRAYQAHLHRESGSIARVLGLDAATENRCLSKLEAAGVIAQEGARYVPVRSLTVDTRAVPQLKTHWCEVARRRLPDQRPEDVFCYNVFSASHQDVERIRQLLLSTYREIRAIVEQTSCDESVALINLQLVHWLDSSDAQSTEHGAWSIAQHRASNL